MVIRVISRYHDYDYTTFYIDPSLLRDDNFIESQIKQELAKDENQHEVSVYLHRDDHPNKNLEGGLASHSVVFNDSVKSGDIKNQVIWLDIQFE